VSNNALNVHKIIITVDASDFIVVLRVEVGFVVVLTS
jgi:hypothetical protein